MSLPLILPLEQCHDPRLVGGKAANLALLLKSGFHVPPGLCVTTEAYHAALSTTDSSASRWHKVLLISEVDRRQLLTDCQKALRNAECSDLIMQILEAVSRLEQPPDALWAVRSSATNEDTGGASFAGLYRTHLGVSFAGIESAIKDVWASLWDERVVEYLQRQRLTSTLPTMAVVIQPLLEARVAGVAYSAHPLTRRTDLVMINAVPGLAASLVGGKWRRISMCLELV